MSRLAKTPRLARHPNAAAVEMQHILSVWWFGFTTFSRAEQQATESGDSVFSKARWGEMFGVLVVLYMQAEYT